MSNLPPQVLKLIKDIVDDKQYPPELIRTPNKALLGAMFFMVYDAKWKTELPFWDMFPLFVLIGKYGDRWLGLNLHYLPYAWRVNVAKQLMTRFSSKKRLQYKDILSAIKDSKVPLGALYFCIRQYLFSHIRSEVYMFNRMNYSTMIENLQPKFKKASESTVYKAILSKFYKKIKGIRKR